MKSPRAILEELCNYLHDIRTGEYVTDSKIAEDRLRQEVLL